MTQHSQALSSQGSTSGSEPGTPDKMRQLLDKIKSMQEAVSIFPESFRDELRKQIDVTGEEYLRVARMAE